MQQCENRAIIHKANEYGISKEWVKPTLSFYLSSASESEAGCLERTTKYVTTEYGVFGDRKIEEDRKEARWLRKRSKI